jgi:hypothetical protein
MNLNTLEDALKYINDKKRSQYKAIRKYREKEENKELINNIAKKAYYKMKEDEEKYKIYLEKRNAQARRKRELKKLQKEQ